MIVYSEDSFDEDMTVWQVNVGAYAEVEFFVCTVRESWDDAQEQALDWLADNSPGVFTELGPEDFNGDGEAPDMLVVGHTTYPQFQGTPAIPSWEFHMKECFGATRALALTYLQREACYEC